MNTYRIKSTKSDFFFNVCPKWPLYCMCVHACFLLLLLALLLLLLLLLVPSLRLVLCRNKWLSSRLPRLTGHRPKLQALKTCASCITWHSFFSYNPRASFPRFFFTTGESRSRLVWVRRRGGGRGLNDLLRCNYIPSVFFLGMRPVFPNLSAPISLFPRPCPPSPPRRRPLSGFMDLKAHRDINRSWKTQLQVALLMQEIPPHDYLERTALVP